MNAWYPSFFGYVILISLARVSDTWSTAWCDAIFFSFLQLFIHTVHTQLKGRSYEDERTLQSRKKKKQNDDYRFRP